MKLCTVYIYTHEEWSQAFNKGPLIACTSGLRLHALVSLSEAVNEAISPSLSSFKHFHSLD